MTMPGNPGMFAQAVAEAEERKRQLGITGVTPSTVSGVPVYNAQTANGGNYKFTTPGAMAYQPGQGPLAPPAGPDGGPAQAPAPQAEKYQLLYSEKDGTKFYLKPGGNPENPQDVIKERPGSAGSKGGLALKTKTEQGGFQVNEELLGKYEASHNEAMLQIEEGRKKASAIANERQGYLQEQRAQAQKEAAQQENVRLVQQNEVSALRGKYDQAEKAYLAEQDSQENPMKDPRKAGRMFIGGLLGTLGASLGALGATTGRTPNFVAEALDRDAERRLRTDQARLRVKSDTKDNVYAQLKDQMGTTALADNAYRAIMAKQDMLGAQMLAAKEQDVDRQQALTQLAASREEAYLKYRIQLDTSSQGEVTKQFVNLPGSAARAASREAVSMEEHGKIANTAGTIASTAKTRGEAGKDEKGSPLGQPALEAVSGAVNTIAAADSIQKNLAARGVSADTNIDDPVSGGFDKAREVVSPLHSRANNALRADTTTMAKGLQSAFGKSDRDAEDAEAMATGSASGSDRLRAAQSAKDRAVRVVREQLSNMTPEQQRQRLSAMPEVVRREVLGQQ